MGFITSEASIAGHRSKGYGGKGFCAVHANQASITHLSRMYRFCQPRKA